MKKILKNAFISLLIAFVIIQATPQYANAQGKTIIRVGFTSGADSPPGRESKVFKQILESRLPGKVEVQIFPDEQLGKGTEMLQNVKLGNLEMGVFISEIPGLDPRLGFIELPWMFDDVSHFQKAMSGPIGKELLSVIDEKGIKALSIWWNGFRQVGTVKKAIRRPEDMKGMKIRIAANPQRTETFKALGAAPTMIPVGEVYTSLQLGVVDGAEATTFIWPQTQWDKVVKYFTLLNYSCAPNFALMSKKFWDSLSPDIQKAVLAAVVEVEKYSYEKANQWNDEYLNMMDKKVEIIKLTPDVFSAFRKAVESVNDGFKQKFGSKWLDMAAGMREKK